MTSKDNDRLHNKFREYFDRPISYSPQGIIAENPKIMKPMEVYEKISPPRTI
jgi:hypothetical protein